MQLDEDKRYPISEVSELVGVPIHLLRQWEERFPRLRPKRDRANRRYYLAADIRIALRIKELLHDDRMTSEGARIVLAQELRGHGRPKTTREVVDLLDFAQSQIRQMIDLLDEVDDIPPADDEAPEQRSPGRPRKGSGQ